MWGRRVRREDARLVAGEHEVLEPRMDARALADLLSTSMGMPVRVPQARSGERSSKRIGTFDFMVPLAAASRSDSTVPTLM